jgi:hypothetical protein
VVSGQFLASRLIDSMPGTALAISFAITIDNPDHQDNHHYE